MAECNLNNIGFQGTKYTRCNRRQAPGTVRARLDRACANPTWLEKYPDATVTHRANYNSDHRMLLMELTPRDKRNKIIKKSHFRFEARWLQSEECKRVVEAAWSRMVDRDAHIRLWKKIQDCRVGLLQWNRVEFEQPRREIKQLEERYAHLEGSELDATTHQEMMNIKARLAENEVREMLRW
ncbi:UNVERIFIED_CONTAM: hypothetical protein Sradi_5528100 [Sesamum radiatum]|uniref:Uncharacterized protein n=1 Tax=Sesamum radiatum TaxID=300843 RepID=A0AAW2LBM6_SESRA